MRLGSPPLLSESNHRVRGLRKGSIFLDPPGNSPLWSGRTPLRNSSAQRQLESLSPHGLGSLLGPVPAAPPSLSSVFCDPGM